jgi:hypothetical protein
MGRLGDEETGRRGDGDKTIHYSLSTKPSLQLSVKQQSDLDILAANLDRRKGHRQNRNDGVYHC